MFCRVLVKPNLFCSIIAPVFLLFVWGFVCFVKWAKNNLIYRYCSEKWIGKPVEVRHLGRPSQGAHWPRVKMYNSRVVYMRHVVSRTHNSKWNKENCGVWKSGLLQMEAAMSVGISNVGIDSKTINSWSLTYYIDEFFGERGLFLGKTLECDLPHSCIIYDFSCVNSQGI